MHLLLIVSVFFFQAEDGIRDLVRSRGLGDVYKRQGSSAGAGGAAARRAVVRPASQISSSTGMPSRDVAVSYTHLTLPTSDLV